MVAPVDVMGLVRDKDRADGIDFERDIDARYHVIYGDEIAKPLPPKQWLCRDLGIAPGPPTILGGAGFGGKTMAAQALAMAVATGEKLWGQFAVRQGAVLHLDWEQDELTVRRYQRMARSMRIDLTQLGRMLGSSLTPNAYLDDPGGERALAYLCTGKVLCIADSFRAAFPKAQENDSASVYAHLAMLKRVSKATGCTMLTIAHARKMGDDTDDPRSSLRGSAAMFDASATVYMLDGAKGKPTRVTNTKERNTGKLRDAFGLRIVDEIGPRVETSEPGDDDLDPEWGLRVEYLSSPELQAEYLRSVDSDDTIIAMNSERLATLGQRMLTILSRAPEGLSFGTWRAVVGCSAQDLNAVIPEMIKRGAVSQEGRGSTASYNYVETFPCREPGED